MIDGLGRIPLQVFADERGWVTELRRESGLPRATVQTNVSFSRRGVIRGLHYHERQDARFAQAAHDVSAATGKPILTATEIAVAFPDNAGPATVRATGRVCYPSADRAVTALGHLWRRSRYLSRRNLSQP